MRQFGAVTDPADCAIQYRDGDVGRGVRKLSRDRSPGIPSVPNQVEWGVLTETLLFAMRT